MTRDEMQAQMELLRQENDRLRRARSVLVEDFVGARKEKATLREENAQLRAAIERVRALHKPDDYCGAGCGKWGCPTLRALDGEDA
jgi:hypothetical protein